MKNKTIIPLIVVLLVVSFPSCSNFVENVDPLFDVAESEALNEPGQAEFFLRGVKGRFYSWWQREYTPTELHGDAFYWDPRIRNDYMSENKDLVFGAFQFSNYRDYDNIMALRMMADEMIERLPLMNAGGELSTEMVDEMKWWGYTMGGYALMNAAIYYGLSADGTKPGAVVSPDPVTGEEFGHFYSSEDMLGFAIAKFDLALGVNYDPGGEDGIADAGHAKRIVNSFKARSLLFRHSGGMGGAANNTYLAAAATAAAAGLMEGDDPFVVTVGEGFTNPYWENSGRADYRTVVDIRFVKYVLADPDEGIIINGHEEVDLGFNPKLTAAVITDDPSSEDFPTFGAGGYSLAEKPPYQEGGVWYNLEGTSGMRGHFNATNPRAGAAESLGLTGDQTERLPLFEVPIGATYGYPNYDYGPFYLLPLPYAQDRYPIEEDDMAVIEWQEMNLIRAEVAIRAGNDDEARILINENRESHGLDPIATVADMEPYVWGGAAVVNPQYAKLITGPLGFLIQERDKELFMKGIRLYDQYRFDLWHLDPPSPTPGGGEWVYWPLPQDEFETNPNIDPTMR